MKKKIKGYIAKTDFNNIEKYSKHDGSGVEVFLTKEDAKDVMPKRTKIVECELIIIN